jgi:hypothetical protein
MWLSWLVAVGCTLWLMWRASKTALHLFWMIPQTILEDYRHAPVVACLPLPSAKHRETMFDWWLGVILWVELWGSWLLWMFHAGTLFPVFLAEIVFFFWSVPGGSIPSDFPKKLQRLCHNPEERNAWLALFEKQYPELAALPPLLLPPQPTPYGKGFLMVLALLSPLIPILLQLILSGYLLLAIQIVATLFLAFLSAIPLVRWVGILVGGRYAWWVEYHVLVKS